MLLRMREALPSVLPSQGKARRQLSSQPSCGFLQEGPSPCPSCRFVSHPFLKAQSGLSSLTIGSQPGHLEIWRQSLVIFLFVFCPISFITGHCHLLVTIVLSPFSSLTPNSSEARAAQDGSQALFLSSGCRAQGRGDFALVSWSSSLR